MDIWSTHRVELLFPALEEALDADEAQHLGEADEAERTHLHARGNGQSQAPGR